MQGGSGFGTADNMMFGLGGVLTLPVFSITESSATYTKDITITDPTTGISIFTTNTADVSMTIDNVSIKQLTSAWSEA